MPHAPPIQYTINEGGVRALPYGSKAWRNENNKDHLNLTRFLGRLEVLKKNGKEKEYDDGLRRAFAMASMARTFDEEVRVVVSTKGKLTVQVGEDLDGVESPKFSQEKIQSHPISALRSLELHSKPIILVSAFLLPIVLCLQSLADGFSKLQMFVGQRCQFRNMVG